MDVEISRVTKLKNHESWCVWKFQIEIILDSHDALEIVKGTSVKPEPLQAGQNVSATQKQERDALINAWLKKEKSAKKVIATTIGEQPTLHIINCASSKEMWDKLLSVYEQKSETSILVLQQKWYAYSKQDSDDMATLFLKDRGYGTQASYARRSNPRVNGDYQNSDDTTKKLSALRHCLGVYGQKRQNHG